jgi:hypothetical protein
MAPALATVVTTDSSRPAAYHTAAAYALQSEPLTNQNFLLMRAGDGLMAPPSANWQRLHLPQSDDAHQPNA